jgi:hypothetical protein
MFVKVIPLFVFMSPEVYWFTYKGKVHPVTGHEGPEVE